MTTITPMPAVYGAEDPMCAICDGPITPTDDRLGNWRERVHDGQRRRVHTCCTKDGVARFHRENRPGRTPLDAQRRHSWRWSRTPYE